MTVFKLELKQCALFVGYLGCFSDKEDYYPSNAMWKQNIPLWQRSGLEKNVFCVSNSSPGWYCVISAGLVEAQHAIHNVLSSAMEGMLIQLTIALYWKL